MLVVEWTLYYFNYRSLSKIIIYSRIYLMLVDTSDSLVVVILESSASNPVVFSLRSMAVLVGRAKL